MTETITTAEAATMARQKLGLKISAREVENRVRATFRHLARFEYRQDSLGRTRRVFTGVKRRSFLNLLNGRNHASNVNELFSTSEWEF